MSFAALVAFLASPALTKYAPQPVRESEAGKTVIEWLNCVAMSLDCTNPKTHADTDGENNNGSTGVDDEEKSDTDAGDECTSTDSENNSRGSNEKQWYHNQWRLNLNPDHWLGVDMLLSVLPEIVTRNI